MTLFVLAHTYTFLFGIVLVSGQWYYYDDYRLDPRRLLGRLDNLDGLPEPTLLDYFLIVPCPGPISRSKLACLERNRKLLKPLPPPNKRPIAFDDGYLLEPRSWSSFFPGMYKPRPPVYPLLPELIPYECTYPTRVSCVPLMQPRSYLDNLFDPYSTSLGLLNNLMTLACPGDSPRSRKACLPKTSGGKPPPPPRRKHLYKP